MKSKSRTKRKIYGAVMQALVRIASVAVCLLVIFMTGYVLIKGIPNISWELISSSPSYLSDRVGILPDILNTLYIILASLVIILPLGVGAAIYLNEYAANKKVVALIEYAAETLSGIPSIIYGLVGMLFFCRFLKMKTSLIAGALTLVIMNLPTVMRTTQESLKTVPQSYREGAFGLGAGKWRTVRTVVLPDCIDGIVTGCILSVGRIIGESAVHGGLRAHTKRLFRRTQKFGRNAHGFTLCLRKGTGRIRRSLCNSRNTNSNDGADKPIRLARLALL